eukprot:343961_1
MPKGKKAKKRRNANVNYQTYTHNLTKQIRLKKCENAHWRNNPWASCALNQCANLLSNYIQIKQQNVQPLVHAIRLASKSNKQRTAVSLCKVHLLSCFHIYFMHTNSIVFIAFIVTVNT